jgi:hypothetical protein
MDMEWARAWALAYAQTWARSSNMDLNREAVMGMDMDHGQDQGGIRGRGHGY